MSPLHPVRASHVDGGHGVVRGARRVIRVGRVGEAGGGRGVQLKPVGREPGRRGPLDKLPTAGGLEVGLGTDGVLVVAQAVGDEAEQLDQGHHQAGGEP